MPDRRITDLAVLSSPDDADALVVDDVSAADTKQLTIAGLRTALGAVVGPASATDNAVARFDGTTGKLAQNSAVTITDQGVIAAVGAQLRATAQGVAPNRYAEVGEVSDTIAIFSAKIFVAEVSPEGVISANPGSVCFVRYSPANANDGLWSKTAGGGNTGWTHLGAGGGGVTDHGALTGLADDDHTQYLLANGTRALSGNLSVGAAVTIDGRDVSADGATLDAHVGAGGAAHANAVAAGAAGFMTGADKSKLDGIETAADVTDATNVAAAGAVMDSDFAGSAVGVMRRTGAGAYAVLKDNLAATDVPAVTDDSGDGYAVGSLWAYLQSAWICTDATVGAAVWRRVPWPGDSPGVAVTDTGFGSIGSSEDFAREDHTHDHGSLGGGSLHAVATPGAAGFAPVGTPITESGTTRTLTNADHGRTILCTHASGCAVTVPHTLTAGFSCTLVQRGGASAPVTAAGSGGLTVTPPAAFNAATAQDVSPMTLYVESATVALCWGDLDPV